MVTAMVVVLGAVSLGRLQIDLLPAIELPTVTVRTDYEGASPEVIERLVTEPIEEIVATVPGVEEITSSSSEGRSQVRVTFSWGIDVDTGALDLQSKLEDELNELPDEIVRPRVSKFDVASFPVVILGISSALDPVDLTELIEDEIRYRFARVPGVAQVDLWGEFQREVRVELDPERLKALELPLDGIVAALRDANLDLPTGKIESGRHEVTLRAPAEFEDLDQIGATVLAVRDGVPVTVGQVAAVRDTYQKLTRIVRVNGERGLRIGIRKQSHANTVEVSRAVMAEIERVNADFPQVEVVAVSNQGNFIERSIANVAQSVLYGGALAVLVLLVFLRSLRSTLVIALSIPISVVATFALIYFGGLTLNLMTLGGLALGVGMMVDSSVVVLENVFRHARERGEPPSEASEHGAREVGPAILASTLTTVVIFLPLAFVQGVSGLLFQELAYVVCFALVCSLFVSLSVVPMLSSRLLERSAGAAIASGGSRRLAAAGERLESRLDSSYRDLLEQALRRRWTTVFVSFGLLGASLLLLPFIGSEFLPPSDEGEVRVTGEMEVGTRLDLVDRQTRLMEELALPEVPELQAIVASSGASGFNADAAARGELQLSLVPASQRERSNLEVADALRERLGAAVPGMEIRTRAPQGQFLLERVLGGDEGLQVELRGFDFETLGLLAEQAAELVAAVPGVVDVDVSRDDGVPQQELCVDRDKAADLGLSVRDVTEALETAIAGTRAGEYRVGGHSYRILVQLADAERRSIDEVLDLSVTAPTGTAIALRNVIEAEPSRGPMLIERKDQQRQVTITANVAGRDQGSVALDVQAALDALPRPQGYELAVAGSYEEQQRSTRELLMSFLLALVLVYMVLACQYESLVDPLIVMFSVPVAAVGVLITLILTDTTLNVQSYIGCIMLGGIVVNNAILLVDQAASLHRAGTPVDEALAEAGRRRLRPILMTTLTTILALLPLAFGIGEGADAQAPLARAVVGGLIGSSVISLVLIPAVYSLVHRPRPAHAVQPAPATA